MARGIDVFDQSYKPVANTFPQKFTTSYDARVEPDLQRMYEEATAGKAGFMMCAFDTKGYLPAHLKHLSEPCTGDRDKDLLVSRHKRMYEDDSTQRAIKHPGPYLFQTYIRDTGDILNDLAVPIMVNGRRWGALRGIFPPKLVLSGN